MKWMQKASELEIENRKLREENATLRKTVTSFKLMLEQRGLVDEFIKTLEAA